jgi:hypothetical protein
MVFQGCVFDHCYRARGGAIYLSNSGLTLGLVQYALGNCKASAGSALFIKTCCSFSMNDTSGTQCTSSSDNPFAFVRLESTDLGHMELSQCLVSLCQVHGDTIEGFCSYHTPGSMTTSNH